MGRPRKKPQKTFDSCYKNLMSAFCQMDEKTLVIANPLIENAAFLEAQLDELQKKIMQDGVSCEYKNGENQSGVKMTPEMQSYTIILQKYARIVSILYSMLPKDNPAANEILEFMREGQKL